MSSDNASLTLQSALASNAGTFASISPGVGVIAAISAIILSVSIGTVNGASSATTDIGKLGSIVVGGISIFTCSVPVTLPLLSNVGRSIVIGSDTIVIGSSDTVTANGMSARALTRG
jgi:hypothetical protein